MSTDLGATLDDLRTSGSLAVMDTNATTVADAQPEDLIATMWFRMGFRPTQSLVVAGLQGAKNRLGTVQRIDLPGPKLIQADLRTMVRGLLDLIRSSGANALVAMVADEQVLAGPTPAIVKILRREARVQRVRVLEVLGVTSKAYRSLICRDPRCCPSEGTAISTVMMSRAAATHVLNGDVIADSAEGIVADVLPQAVDETPPPARCFAGQTAGRSLPPGERLRWWQNWTSVMTAVSTGSSEGCFPLPGLSGALFDPLLRDAVLMHVLGAPCEQLATMLAVREGEPANVDLDRRASRLRSGPEMPELPTVSVLMSRPPDERRLANGTLVLAGAARAAAAGSRAPALAVLAMLAWYQGNGGRSRLLAERARADFPALSLTALVDDLLRYCIPPPWFGPGKARAER